MGMDIEKVKEGLMEKEPEPLIRFPLPLNVIWIANLKGFGLSRLKN